MSFHLRRIYSISQRKNHVGVKENKDHIVFVPSYIFSFISFLQIQLTSSRLKILCIYSELRIATLFNIVLKEIKNVKRSHQVI